MKDNFVYINHIIDAISKINFYITDYNFDFFYDDKTVDAVVREIEIYKKISNKIQF